MATTNLKPQELKNKRRSSALLGDYLSGDNISYADRIRYMHNPYKDPATVTKKSKSSSSKATGNAKVRELQKAIGVPVTGTMDEATRAEMARRRQEVVGSLPTNTIQKEKPTTAKAKINTPTTKQDRRDARSDRFIQELGEAQSYISGDPTAIDYLKSAAKYSMAGVRRGVEKVGERIADEAETSFSRAFPYHLWTTPVSQLKKDFLTQWEAPENVEPTLIHLIDRLKEKSDSPIRMEEPQGPMPAGPLKYNTGGRIQDGSGLQNTSRLMGAAAGPAAAIPVAGPFIAAGLTIGSAVTGAIGNKKARSFAEQQAYNQYIPADANTNQSMYGNFNYGGSLDQLSSDSFEVLGKHGYDANKFTIKGQPVALTRGETVDLSENRVMSNEFEMGGKSFSDIDKKYKKARGKAEKSVTMSPSKEAQNTIDVTKMLEDKLFQAQEEIATMAGLRGNNAPGYRGGGNMSNKRLGYIGGGNISNERLGYQYGGNTDPPIDPNTGLPYDTADYFDETDYSDPSIAGNPIQFPTTTYIPESFNQKVLEMTSIPSNVNTAALPMAGNPLGALTDPRVSPTDYTPQHARSGIADTNIGFGRGKANPFQFEMDANLNIPGRDPFSDEELAQRFPDEGLYRPGIDQIMGSSGPLTKPPTTKPGVDEADYFADGLGGEEATAQKKGFLGDMTLGDKIGLGSNLLALGIKASQAFKKPQKFHTRQDTTPITAIDFRPDRALSEVDIAHRTGARAIQNSSSFNNLRAGIQNLSANTQRARAKVIEDHKRLQQQEAARVQQLRMQQSQYNIGQQNMTEQLNAQSKASRLQNIDTFATSIANLGIGTQRTLNQYKQNEMMLDILRNAYPDVYDDLMSKTTNTSTTKKTR